MLWYKKLIVLEKSKDYESLQSWFINIVKLM